MFFVAMCLDRPGSSQVMVRGWMQIQPEIEPGANEATAQTLERQLKDSRA